MKRILGILSAICVCLTFCGSAMASEDLNMNQDNVIVLYEVGDQIVFQKKEDFQQGIENLPTEHICVSVKTATQNNTVMILFDISGLNKITDDEKMIQIADHFLTMAGYSDEQLQLMSRDNKLALICGAELGIIRQNVVSHDSNHNTYGSWGSTLTFTRKTVQRYFFTVTGNRIGPPFHWANSLCVQGFAVDTPTARFDFAYWVCDSDGTRLKLERGIIRYVDNQSFFYPISDGNGSGLGCTYNTGSAMYVEPSTSNFCLSFYADNSSVNLPGPAPGSTGGSFNIWGNTALLMGPNPVVSFSFPWGISITSGGSSALNCHTSLQATLYR